MSSDDPTPYDAIAYPSMPFAKTRPDHLAMVAALHGMTPAPPSRCRVLELGCGSGGNIVPMACQFRASEFLGIDLSRHAIESGQEMIGQLGLPNVKLQHRDIMDISAADGSFDYIIAHGVYSWVPPPVRDKMLSVFRASLNPQGVVYVSYNALPGGHIRDLARSIMRFHVRDVGDLRAKSAQSRNLMKFIAEVSAEDQIYGFILRDQANRIAALSDEVFIHDDLDEDSAAFYLYQVIEAAGRHGLQYLADSDFPILGLRGRSQKIREMLAGISEEQTALREQYLDFVDGRAFRTSLFCHRDVALRRPAAADRLKTMYLSAALAPEEKAIDVSSKDVVVFRGSGIAALRSNHPLGKAVLVLLARIYPEAIGFDDLVGRGLAMLGSAAPRQMVDEIDALSRLLFEGLCSGLIDAYVEQPSLTSSVSERPKAGAFARWQASNGKTLVTSLLHGGVQCEDQILVRFLPLVDGTRTIAELRSDLRRGMAANPGESVLDIDELTRDEVVQRSLGVMAKLALLEC
jgi:methyltransferase-like protein/ubiquinone/menaquinone biosynthesis C-methylase UbiE